MWDISFLSLFFTKIDRTLPRPRRVTRARFVALRSDSGSGVINDIVGLIAFRRARLRSLTPSSISSRISLPSSVIGEKCFNFVSGRESASIFSWAGKKRQEREREGESEGGGVSFQPDKSDLASVKYSLYPLRGEKILIPIHTGYAVRREMEVERGEREGRGYREGEGWGGTGNRPKVSRTGEIDGLLHIHNAEGTLFRGYSRNLRHSRGKCSEFFRTCVIAGRASRLHE